MKCLFLLNCRPMMLITILFCLPSRKHSGEDLLHFDINETWRAMEECYKLGLAKSIGVSNYSCAKLSKLLENPTIPPAVNQVEINVAWQQQKIASVLLRE
ncbi:methylecgonone reductase-like [Olea europaea subsp. europaea]|uniref:Methylecgonone reductase-like n=1 Tax=Olea europaea subsp. europaea TaxID=158383 RepID=A0A8S0PIC0_OLEEU|nr:methylecgonone reductase-like [Olea europaea subsp. europaea]